MKRFSGSLNIMRFNSCIFSGSAERYTLAIRSCSMLAWLSNRPTCTSSAGWSPINNMHEPGSSAVSDTRFPRLRTVTMSAAPARPVMKFAARIKASVPLVGITNWVIAGLEFPAPMSCSETVLPSSMKMVSVPAPDFSSRPPPRFVEYEARSLPS